MRLIAKLKRFFFPNSPMTYDEIRATYNKVDDKSRDGQGVMSSGHICNNQTFADSAKAIARTTQEKAMLQWEAENSRMRRK